MVREFFNTCRVPQTMGYSTKGVKSQICLALETVTMNVTQKIAWHLHHGEFIV